MKTNLKQLRKKAGWSNANDFAKSIGMSAKTYRNYEQGVRNMGLDVACEICNALGCSINDLVSIEYAIVELPEETLSDDERKLVEYYRRLDDDTKESILRTVEAHYHMMVYKMGGNELLETLGARFVPLKGGDDE